MENNNTKLMSLRELLDRPDRKAVTGIYLNIKVKAFIEYFKALTNRREYYDEVFSALVDLSKTVFDKVPEQQLRETLTIRSLLICSEQLLMNSPYKSLYIIEKALMEPLAICGNIPGNIHSAKPENTTTKVNTRKEVF